MPALNFKKQFVESVKDGTKRQTIRATRKYPIKIGDVLYLYTGMQTKQCTKINEVVCKFVQEFEVTDIGVKLDGIYLTDSQLYRLVIADGFFSALDFFGILSNRV